MFIEKKSAISHKYSTRCCNFEGQFQFLVSPPSYDASAESVGVFVAKHFGQTDLLPLPKFKKLIICQRF